MKIEIVMPKMGESVQEGTILKWHKKVGDKVRKDEIIFEISTDKVDTEVPSPADGIISEIFFKENETVAVGTVVAILETETVNEMPGNEEKERTVTMEESEMLDIPMPKMGESVQEGTILKFHKKIGEHVAKDEILFEISTDKVDTEVPSPEDGIVAEILYKENDTVTVGKTVMRLKVKNARHFSPSDTAEDSNNMDETLQETEKKDGMKPAVSKGERNRFYSPVVMKIAKEENISFEELEKIEGSGINGRVTKKDILRYIEKRKDSLSEYSSTEARKQGRITVMEMDVNRKRIMEHMIKSRDTSVHVSQVMEVDMTIIHNFIEKNAEKFLREENLKLTYLAFIAFATVRALKQFPLMNASIEGEKVIVKNYVNLGIAVAVEPNGLIVPNIKNAEDKSVRGLARSIADLSYRARNKKLTPDDVADGTFSITNYGVFGALFGAPIINQPEVGILGVGAVTKKPVVVDLNGTDVIAVKPMMYLSLSHDHRLVDGMLGGRFLKAVKEYLENFDISNV